jgi:signal transduction histidine kinase
MLTGHKDGHAITLMADWKVSADEQGNALFLLWYTDISELKRAQATIESQSLALRQLNTRLVTALDEERSRIAREFHDQLGQALTAAKLNLYQASVIPRPGVAGRKLHKLLKQAISAMDAATTLTQKLCTDLRPAMLDDASLEEAIRWHVRRIKGWAKARLKLEVEPDLHISRDASEALVRILQESLTNVARHAKAKKIRVTLFRSEKYVRLTIRDNGRGMNMRKIGSGRSLGLLGMRERAAALGGDVEILSQPGRGTTVIARVPIEAPDS